MAAKTKTFLSCLAAVKHGSQDQHGPNLFFLHNQWLSSVCLCNPRRRCSYNKFKLPSACCPMAAARHSSWNAARWRSPTMNSSCLRHTISSSCVRHGAHGARQFPLSVVYQILAIYHNFSTISHHLCIIYHHKPWWVDRSRTICEPSSLNYFVWLLCTHYLQTDGGTQKAQFKFATTAVWNLSHHQDTMV